MAKRKQKETGRSKETQLATNGRKGAIPSLAVVDVNNEDGQAAACKAIFQALAGGTAEHDTTRLMLSTIGKVLTRESLKIKAGIYRLAGVKNNFFLNS